MELRALWSLWAFFLVLSGGAIWGQNREMKGVSMAIFAGLSCFLFFHLILKAVELLT